MAWIRTGTVAVNNGSATVVGTGTNWRAQDLIGQGFDGPDGRTYEIIDVPANGQMTLATPYLGANATGQPYQIQPFRGAVGDLLAATNSLLGSFTVVRDGIGAGLFPDGSAATPAFRFVNDQDTGIYRFGDNTIGLSTGGVVRAVLNGSGNVAIGTTNPGDWRLNVNRGSQGNLVQFTDGVESTFVVRTESGVLQAGQANNLPLAILTNSIERMRIAPAGNVGIGTASPTDILHVKGLIRIEDATDTTLRDYRLNVTNTGAFQIIDSVSGLRFWVDDNGNARPGADNTLALGTGASRWSVVYAGTGTINTSDEREKHWRGELNAAELRAAKRIIAELGIYQWNDAVAEKGEDGARLHFGVRAQRAFQIMEDEGLDWGRYAWACYDRWEEQTEPMMAEVPVAKTRKVMRPSTLIDPATGQPAMVEVDEPYEETEMQPTGETRVTLEAGDRYGVRPDQLAFWLIAAQAAMQAELEGSIAILEARLASLEAA